MALSITGKPPAPEGFLTWQEWAARLSDFLELQGDAVPNIALASFIAFPRVRGAQQIVNLSAATNLVIPLRTFVAFIQAEGQNVRWRDDGIAPTATVGNLIFAGETLAYRGNFARLKLIEVAPTAILNVEYRS
jgi:hypothetical protein